MKRQSTNIEVKKNNRNYIFRYICRHGVVSNPDIAYAVKMSLPTVTQNTKELIERGLIEETGELESTGGRRAKALSVAANARLAAGLDITKNHIGLLLTNLTGEILRYNRYFLPFENEDSYYLTVNEKLEEFLDDALTDREKILGIGISFPGIVDLDSEKIIYSHILGVESMPFASVSRFFKYPCYFLNDANAGAYAEGIRSESMERFFYISLSNTVGGSIFNDDKLVQGKGFRCGEVGHMTVIPDGSPCYCGKLGCLDAYCAASYLSDVTEGKLEQFFVRLEQGDKEIRDIWNRYTDYLAIALNNIHMILDCDIIIGGYVGSYVEPHIQEIWKKVSDRSTFTEDSTFVKSCNYKTGAAALGAALRVIELFIEKI
ncbi:MAG: ROK family transcriptional regulator [Dorea sp.]|jgi:N-acetylglucosamine repressor|nr:ROK family transcriptional regulator [Dorea sp.]